MQSSYFAHTPAYMHSGCYFVLNVVKWKISSESRMGF